MICALVFLILLCALYKILAYALLYIYKFNQQKISDNGEGIEMDSFYDFFAMAVGNVWLYGVTFLVVLSLLVFIHEWGHYIVARLSGVHIETFSIGFGPEIWGFNDRNGTRWKFSAIPLGGYVKMFGDADPTSARHVESIEDENGNSREFTEDEKRVAFYTKHVAKRAAVVFAGPAINFLFAIVVLGGFYMTLGKPVTPPVAAAVDKNGAAFKAGIRPLDRFIAAGDTDIQSFSDIRQEVMLALDTPITFTVRRNGERKTIQVTPTRKVVEDSFGFKHAKGYLGIIGPNNGISLDNVIAVDGIETRDAPDKAKTLISERLGTAFSITLPGGERANELVIMPPKDEKRAFQSVSDNNEILSIDSVEQRQHVSYSPIEATGVAIQETARITYDTLKALGQMIAGTRSAKELGGVIRIGAIAGDMAEKGMISLITFTALLSINLGLINLFPIPMLDGGHLVFYAIEALKGTPLSEQLQEYAFRVGFVILIGIMLFANINDFVQIMT